jgi:hypothetical protein
MGRKKLHLGQRLCVLCIGLSLTEGGREGGREGERERKVACDFLKFYKIIRKMESLVPALLHHPVRQLSTDTRAR